MKIHLYTFTRTITLHVCLNSGIDSLAPNVIVNVCHYNLCMLSVTVCCINVLLVACCLYKLILQRCVSWKVILDSRTCEVPNKKNFFYSKSFLFANTIYRILLLQHYQLLMQTFVLSRFEPSLVFLSQVAAQAVVSNG